VLPQYGRACSASRAAALLNRLAELGREARRLYIEAAGS
jgi:hypothetical protein